MQLATEKKTLSHLELIGSNNSSPLDAYQTYNNNTPASLSRNQSDSALPYYFMKQRKRNDFPCSEKFRTSESELKVKKRIVLKDGDYNLLRTNISRLHQHYWADLFTTLVDIRWRWNLLVFSMAFLTSWLLFAVLWWLVSFGHSDLRSGGAGNNSTNPAPCVQDVTDFTTALLFSIETQHTIGYGGRQITEHCPYAICVMMLQCICGVAIQALMTGLVFAKLSRPKKRAATILFSRTAVIHERNGNLCLVIRVGDIRKSRILEAHAHAILVRCREQGLEQQELNLGETPNIDDSNRVLLSWPIELIHRIDHQSPFYNVTKQSLLSEHFELVVYLEGVVECTGMTTQARTSYLPGEIAWAQRFQPLISYNYSRCQYHIDYSLFHCTTSSLDSRDSQQFLNVSKPIRNQLENMGRIQSV